MWRMIIVLVFVGLCANAASALDGSGTQEDPWLIQSLADFDEFATYPFYWAFHTRLEIDVNLAGQTYTTAVISPDTSSSDGFQGTAFTGVFDGNAHKVIGLTINGETGNDFLGLFGCIDEGEVRNLGLEDSSVSGDYSVGGLVGANGGTLSNCYSTGPVSGTGDYVGGLVGYNSGTINNSYSTGSAGDEVESDEVGGLVGSNWGSISNCYSTGDVNGHAAVGGLVGRNWGSVSNCYSIADVNGFVEVGGLVGNNVGIVTYCYSTGVVSGRYFIGGVVGNDAICERPYGCSYGTVVASFWDTQTSRLNTSAGGAGLTTEQMQTESTFISWACAGVWTIDEGKDYPRLWYENAPGHAITRNYYYGGGSGTPSDPYLIYTAEHLSMIGLIACDWDKNFKLMCDIDLSGYDIKDGRPAFNIIGTSYNTSFNGVFDGNDHKIIGLTINGGVSHYIGLFGCIGEIGEIRNLRLEGVSVSGTGEYVGGLVGRNWGSLSNCYSTGDVNGDWSVGGLVGSNGDWYHPRGSISNCYSTVDVNGHQYVGGLVGMNYDKITQCHINAEVSGFSDVGGLCGTNGGAVDQCYSTGTISGTGYYVGGLVGSNGKAQENGWTGDVTNCYSSAAVSGLSSVGGLVGSNTKYHWGKVTHYYSTGAVLCNGETIGGLVGDGSLQDAIDCFWDTQTSIQETSAGGIGKTTVEMKTISTFTDAGWDFIEIWGIGENQTYPYLLTGPAGDFNYDKEVNLIDLAILASHWLEEN